eukprot:11109429-Heterocapsa_arctica.AAC.1
MEALGLPEDPPARMHGAPRVPRQAQNRGGGKGRSNNEEASAKGNGHAPIIDSAKYGAYPRAR